ncbi:ABC transporter permease [Mesorhizobium sp. PL10]
MGLLSIGYLLALAGVCAWAAFAKRWRDLSLFGFVAAASLLVWAVFGATPLQVITVCAAILLALALVSYLFRRLLVLVLPWQLSQAFGKAPVTAIFGIIIILVFAACAIFAPIVAPFGEADIVSASFAPPDAQMLLGADQLGRDILSRIIFGARTSVGLALIATILAFSAGSLTGLLAATYGGWPDQILSRIADTIMSVPSLIFSLLMLSIFGTDLSVIVVVVAVIYSPRVYRLTRAVAGNVVVMDYIEAAKLRGEGTWYLIRREILPNALAPLIAEFGLEFCFVFLLIAGLSFLGLGVQPPTADWGSMVRENATLISFGDYTPLIPAGAIALLTVAVNFVIDWMLHRSSGLKD